MRALRRLLEKHPDIGPVSLVLNLFLLAVLVAASITEGLSVWLAGPPGIRSATVNRSILERSDRRVIVLRFMTPMPELGVQRRRTPPFVFTPSFTYTLDWRDPRCVYVFPTKPLIPDRRFTVEPRPGLRDLNGRLLDPTPVTTRLVPLSVIKVGVPIRSNDGTTVLDLRFSGRISVKACRERLRVTAVGPGRIRKTAITCSGSKARLRLRHTPDLKKLRITLLPGPAGAGRMRRTPTAWVRELEVPRELAIRNVEAETGYFDPDIRITFQINGELDCTASSKFIHLSPPVDSPVLTPGSVAGAYELRGGFHGRTAYRVRFSPGLRTRSGRVLGAPALFTVVTPRVRPRLRFASSGLYLPGTGTDTIAVRAAGIASFQVTVRRVYGRNLVRLVEERPSWEETVDRLGPVRVVKTVSVPSAGESPPHTFSLAVSDLMGGAPPGVYLLQLKTERTWGWYGPHRTRTIVWTHLTATAVRGRDRSLTAWVRNMGDGSPADGCDVQVLSKRNLVLGRGRSGPEGLVRLLLDQSPAARDETPALLVVRKNADLSLLPLNAAFARGEVESESRGEQGYPELPYSAFVYAERDLCRPGESMRFAFLVRDRELRPAGGFPVRFSITGPKGRRFISRRLDLDPSGYAATEVAFPSDARTGGYGAVVAGASPEAPAYGRFSFLVLPYVPARVRVRLEADRSRYTANGKAQLKVAARYYFGRPAGGCRVVIVSALQPRSFSPTAFRGFTFGCRDPDRSLPPPRRVGRFVTDEAGLVRTILPLPAPEGIAAPLTLVLTAVVHQPGGRTVAATIRRPFDPTSFYLGVRREPAPAAPGPGQRESFSWICLSAAERLRPPPTPMRFSLYRIVWRSTLRLNADKEYVRTWTEQATLIKKGAVPADSDASRGRFTVECPGVGLWELRLEAGQAESRLRFTAGAAAAPVRSGNGSGPVVTRDKPTYLPGETARLRFSAAAPGRLLLCLSTDRVIEARVVPVTKGSNTIGVRIPQTPFGCVYAALYLQSPPGNLGGVFRPDARFGLTLLPISQARHRVGVSLEAPETARPGASIQVAVRLESNSAPVAGQVDLFAVDAGILSLTNYATPAPFDFYFGKRRCGIQVYDGLAHFYPDVSDLPRLGIGTAVGGDQMAGLLRGTQPEAAGKPAVLYLGIVTVPPSGRTSATVTLPEFNGALRFMAVATAGAAMGSGERLVRVRDRVTIQATAPRAVACGDEFDLAVHAVNNDLPETRCRFTLTLDAGPADIVGEATRDITLAEHGDMRFAFHLAARADDSGPVRLFVHCFTESGAELGSARVALAVRPAALPISLSGMTFAAAGKQLRLNPPSGLRAETADFSVHVSTGYGAAAMPALAWLGTYPYGCLEQTTSKALPFLYVRSTRPGALGNGNALPGDDALFAAAVRKAVRRLRRMQLPSGGFAMWPGGAREWHEASFYAGHFLICCRDAGLGPGADAWSRLGRYLTAAVVNPPLGRSNRLRGYAHYLLARIGKAEPGLAEAFLRMKNDGDDSTGYVLAAASLVLAGRARHGAKWFNQLLARPNWSPDSDDLLGTPVSGIALAAIALEQAFPGSPALPGLIQRLLHRRRKETQRWDTTFENALAATAILRWQALNPNAEQTRGTVCVNSGPEVPVGARHPFEYRARTGNPVQLTITNHGPGRLFAAWFARGIPRAPLLEPEYRGLEIRREYLSPGGEARRRFRKGDPVTVRIQISGGRDYRNVVIVDLLPGGLEVEDHIMLSSSTAGAVFTGKKPDHVEVLDDRVLFFGALDGNGNTIRYTCRAVSCGRFAAPPVAAYPMYAPNVYARAPGGPPIHIRN